MVVMLLIGGAVLFSLGVIAEYIGVAVNMAMGKPLYLIVSDAADGPLGAPSPTANRVIAEPIAQPETQPKTRPSSEPTSEPTPSEPASRHPPDEAPTD